MVTLASSDMGLTVALASNLVRPLFDHADTGGVPPFRSIKVAVAGKTYLLVIEVLFRVFVETFHAKLAMNTLSVVLAFIAYTPRCVPTCLTIMHLHENIKNGIEIGCRESQITEKTLSSK